MAKKNVNARIVHKNDTQTNWAKATGFTPELGELIVYRTDDTYNFPRFKLGDGTKNPVDLPFLGIVQSGGDFNIDNDGVVTINDDSHNHVISNVDGLQDKLDEIDTHQHSVTHKPAGTIANTSITPAGTVTSTFTGTAKTHKHTFTGTQAAHGHTFTGTDATIEATYTPEGTVNSTFTGSAATSGGPSNTATVASSTHTHKYTPVGTVSKPTFTGSETDTGAAVGTTTVYSITGVGTLPSHTYTAASLTASVANRCLTLNFNAGSHTFDAGSLPTKGSGVTVATGAHTHKVTATGAVSQPTFTGTEGSTTSISGTTTVANNSHTHSVTAKGSVASTFSGTETTISAEYTPEGSISDTAIKPAGTITDTSITPEGTITSTFSGTAASHKHTFTGTEATLTTSIAN